MRTYDKLIATIPDRRDVDDPRPCSGHGTRNKQLTDLVNRRVAVCDKQHTTWRREKRAPKDSP